MPTVEKTTIPQHTDWPPSPDMAFMEERPFVRKRKESQPTENPKTSKKTKDSEEQTDRQVDRPIPGDMWCLAFNIGHKIILILTKPRRKW